VERRLDGSFADAECAGDLRDRELLEVSEDHDGPTGGGQDLQEVGQVVGFGIAVVELGRRVLSEPGCTVSIGA